TPDRINRPDSGVRSMAICIVPLGRRTGRTRGATMSLHQDLLQHAGRLAKLDPRRPKQVNLRRAVSAAYYALFHLLTAATSALYAGELGLAARINRTLNHREMKKASQMIGNDKLPRGLQPAGGGYKTPTDLKAVADAFVMLQQWRHDADYDLSKKFSRRQ